MEKLMPEHIETSEQWSEPKDPPEELGNDDLIW